jgi:phage baseplate assembly protein W
MSFADGGLRLTASTLIQTRNEDALNDLEVSNRSVLTATDEERRDVVRQSLRRIISTPLASRWFAGGYGSRVDEVPFEVNDEITQATAATFAEEAIRANEDRVELVQSGVQQDEDNPVAFKVILGFRINDTNVMGNVIVPKEFSS